MRGAGAAVHHGAHGISPHPQHWRRRHTPVSCGPPRLDDLVRCGRAAELRARVDVEAEDRARARLEEERVRGRAVGAERRAGVLRGEPECVRRAVRLQREEALFRVEHEREWCDGDSEWSRGEILTTRRVINRSQRTLEWSTTVPLQL